MKNIKSFEKFILEYENFTHRTSIDNPEGFVTNVLGEKDLDEYMFFQNLKIIKESIDMMLSLNPQKVNDLLKDGHAWAVDHISTSKDDVEEVAGFLKGRLTGSVQEGKTSDFNRILAMSPTWWVAWQEENKDKGYEITKDAFSRTYEVSKDGNVVFLYDYGRNKVFTNEDPQSFVLGNEMSQEELDDLKKKAEGIGKSKKTDSNEPNADQGTEDTEEENADSKNSDTEEE